MDHCAHLLYGCKTTREFNLPDEFTKLESRKEPARVFTEKENEINLLRCKKQNFYASFPKKKIHKNSSVLKNKVKIRKFAATCVQEVSF